MSNAIQQESQDGTDVQVVVSYSRKPRTVYGLRDPRTMAIRYVGCSVNPEKRLTEHLHGVVGRGGVVYSDYPGSEFGKSRWLWEVIVSGYYPEVVILHSNIDDVEEAHAVEGAWIEYFRSRGADLFNCKQRPHGKGARADKIASRVRELVAELQDAA